MAVLVLVNALEGVEEVRKVLLLDTHSGIADGVYDAELVVLHLAALDGQ